MASPKYTGQGRASREKQRDELLMDLYDLEKKNADSGRLYDPRVPEFHRQELRDAMDENLAGSGSAKAFAEGGQLGSPGTTDIEAQRMSEAVSILRGERPEEIEGKFRDTLKKANSYLRPPSSSPSETGKMTEADKRFHMEMTGKGGQGPSLDEILKMLGKSYHDQARKK
tara:strand:- start:3997 stop:4506 length:510 start_codon:yes stop_codon:yes gene_type:complete